MPSRDRVLNPHIHNTQTSTSRCTQSKHHHRFLFFWSGLARRTACKPSLLLPMKRYNPRSSVHHHIHYHHHRHLTSVLFLHVREYFQPSLNEVTIRVPTGRGPGYTARTARRSLMRRQDVTAFRSPVNPLLPPSPFLHITTCPPPGARALSFTFRSLCLPRFVRTLLLCLPRVRVLLVESVLPGFPPPDGSGSGRTVLERAASLCAACASCFELPFQSGDAAPAAALRASSAFRSGDPASSACRLYRVGGERHPSLRHRLRLLVLL